jgi:hypothetical protein
MADNQKADTSSALSEATKTPLHDQVFARSRWPDNDSRAAIGQNAALLTPAAQPEGFGPMTAVGDNDRRHSAACSHS